MRSFYALMLAGWCFTAGAAEMKFNFVDTGGGGVPPGFTNLLAGGGAPGEWKVVMDEVTPMMAPIAAQAPVVTARPVLGQLSHDPTDERFPMLAYEGEAFGDFTLTTRFKIVSGTAEQMAGIAFRLLDEKNFYVIRASALGRNIRFYKVVNGLRSQPIGPELEVAKEVWHQLKITCKGNQIRCEFNGREAFPPLNDSTFRSGKIAFWTKSDSVAYFTDTAINYTPLVPLGQSLVTGMIEKYPRLIALKIYALDRGTNTTRIIASKDESEIGQPGGKYELATIEKGEIFYAKEKSYVAMVMPLRDRNGDIVAATRIHMTTFPGQTEKNALIRATPIAQEMQLQIRGTQDSLD